MILRDKAKAMSMDENVRMKSPKLFITFTKISTYKSNLGSFPI